MEKEDATHVLFNCAYPKSVWQNAGITPTLLQDYACLGIDFLHKVNEYELMESGITARVVMILWSLWNERNELVFQRCIVAPGALIQRA